MTLLIIMFSEIKKGFMTAVLNLMMFGKDTLFSSLDYQWKIASPMNIAAEGLCFHKCSFVAS